MRYFLQKKNSEKRDVMKDQTPIVKELQQNIERFETLFEGCADIKKRKFALGQEADVTCYIAFIEVTVSNMMLSESILGKMLSRMCELSRGEIYRYITENGLGISDVSEILTIEDAAALMMTGDAVVFIDGCEKAYKIAGKGYPDMGVQSVQSEQVTRGSRESFTDSVKANTALIRKRIRSHELKVKEIKAGRRTQTLNALVYMDSVVRKDILENVEKRLEEIDIDGVLDSGILEQLMEDSWKSPFPQFQTTERPDKAAMAVLEGRIVLLTDNSPVSIILPVNYNSFFQTTDDYYNRWEIVTIERLIRYAASFLAMLLPAMYLAVTNFHTQLLPTELVLAFAKAREGVPFSAVVEVLLMELAFELLREAGVRIPGSLGSTIGIVGGLIIGQAAVTANLVSPIVVIVVAVTALSSFAIPNEEFASAYRILKFLFILVAAFMGYYGILLAGLLLLMHLSGLESFGIPYLTPFVAAELNDYEEWKDSLVRQPLFRLLRRPLFARKDQRIRMKRKGDA